MGGAAVTAVDQLRGRFLAEVHAECAELLSHANAEAHAIRVAAAAQGRALVEQARAEGTAAASLDGVHQTGRARRHGRALVLAERRALYDDLRAQALAAAQELRGAPGYDALLERLAVRARAQLGADAELEVDPAGAGGVRAHAGHRHVDYTLPALVVRCLDALGTEVERLWA